MGVNCEMNRKKTKTKTKCAFISFYAFLLFSNDRYGIKYIVVGIESKRHDPNSFISS